MIFPKILHCVVLAVRMLQVRNSVCDLPGDDTKGLTQTQTLGHWGRGSRWVCVSPSPCCCHSRPPSSFLQANTLERET